MHYARTVFVGKETLDDELDRRIDKRRAAQGSVACSCAPPSDRAGERGETAAGAPVLADAGAARVLAGDVGPQPSNSLQRTCRGRRCPSSRRWHEPMLTLRRQINQEAKELHPDCS